MPLQPLNLMSSSNKQQRMYAIDGPISPDEVISGMFQCFNSFCRLFLGVVFSGFFVVHIIIGLLLLGKKEKRKCVPSGRYT